VQQAHGVYRRHKNASTSPSTMAMSAERAGLNRARVERERLRRIDLRGLQRSLADGNAMLMRL
jgi:hypothetical protein